MTTQVIITSREREVAKKSCATLKARPSAQGNSTEVRVHYTLIQSQSEWPTPAHASIYHSAPARRGRPEPVSLPCQIQLRIFYRGHCFDHHILQKLPRSPKASELQWSGLYGKP
mmetsp:Transcript_30751/g.81736  ORF Transcript_30751/g.81736 Transcript_30751/m.81736 type:complete len:114 (-) Transcript_30751:488-829(-)